VWHIGDAWTSMFLRYDSGFTHPECRDGVSRESGVGMVGIGRGHNVICSVVDQVRDCDKSPSIGFIEL